MAIQYRPSLSGLDAISIVTLGTTNGLSITSDQILSLALFSAVSPGAVPTSGGGTSNYLRADGTWTTPPGTGATTALDNLASVAINTDLLPGVSSSIDLGSTTKIWDNSFINTVRDASNAASIDFSARNLSSTSGVTMLNWSNAATGLDANTHKIVNVVDPTAAQDVATKNYVDTNTSVSTAWVAYTPTFTNVTGSNIEIYSKRDGSDLLIRGRVDLSAGAGAEMRMQLGFNGTSGGITSTSVTNIQTVGDGCFYVATTAQLKILIEASVGYITFGIQDASNSGLTKQTGASIAGGVGISFNCRVPISGW